MNWHWIDKGLNAGEDGNEGEAPSGDIEASGAVARGRSNAPASQSGAPPPSPRDDDKALDRRIALDDAMTPPWRPSAAGLVEPARAAD